MPPRGRNLSSSSKVSCLENEEDSVQLFEKKGGGRPEDTITPIKFKKNGEEKKHAGTQNLSTNFRASVQSIVTPNT
jgi:hypothetical protein